MQTLSMFALRPLLCAAVGNPADTALDFIIDHLTDHSDRLGKALREASDRAWRALEVALQGESLWRRLDRTEDRLFRQQLRVFLDTVPLHDKATNEQFRNDCLRELKAARRSGLLAGNGDTRAIAAGARALLRYTDPQALLGAEWQALAQMAKELQQAGYPHLGDCLSLRSTQGSSLLVLAARYFFRRAVEEDGKLFQGLAFTQLERLQEAQEAALAGLHQALTEHDQRLADLLNDVQVAVKATRHAVLDVRQELRLLREQNTNLARQNDDLYEAVLKQQARLDLLLPQVRPQDSLSVRSEEERTMIRAVVARYRQLPEEQRKVMPALLNAIGQLEMAAGDFQAAGQDFTRVTTLVRDAGAKGAAHVNAYQAALERRDWTAALAELIEAIRLDPKRFAPFPVGKYPPRRILGAGGFGVAFLCRHKELAADVVVKALHGNYLDRSLDNVFTEARVLYNLDHPAIIRLLDCGFTIPAIRSRPFLVMKHFDGQTLEEYVQQHGPLGLADGVTVAQLIAQGLQAAHQQGILHRDVKPANVLVRKDAFGWQAKLIDFGLALRANAMAGTTRDAATRGRSIAGRSLAGTPDYAAPEQLGKLPGVPVSPSSDAYGFAKTCCYVLFQTTQPLPKHWRCIPGVLADLLEHCLEENPQGRPGSFEEIQRQLKAAETAGGDVTAAAQADLRTNQANSTGLPPKRGNRPTDQTDHTSWIEDRPLIPPGPGPIIPSPHGSAVHSGGKPPEWLAGPMIAEPGQAVQQTRLRNLLGELLQAQRGVTRTKCKTRGIRWAIAIGLTLGVLGYGAVADSGWEDQQAWDWKLLQKYGLADPDLGVHVPASPPSTYEQQRKAAEERRADLDRRLSEYRAEFKLGTTSTSKIVIRGLLVGLGLALLPTGLLLGWKHHYQRYYKAKAAEKTRAISEQYPELVRAWGGVAVLNNVATVQGLLDSLDRMSSRVMETEA
jgi:serine/threonine protein kinase